MLFPDFFALVSSRSDQPFTGHFESEGPGHQWGHLRKLNTRDLFGFGIVLCVKLNFAIYYCSNCCNIEKYVMEKGPRKEWVDSTFTCS